MDKAKTWYEATLYDQKGDEMDTTGHIAWTTRAKTWQGLQRAMRGQKEKILGEFYSWCEQYRYPQLDAPFCLLVHVVAPHGMRDVNLYDALVFRSQRTLPLLDTECFDDPIGFEDFKLRTYGELRQAARIEASATGR